MQFITKSIFFCCLILCGSTLFAQKSLTTVGIQYKPIFPIDFLGTGPLTNDFSGVQFKNQLTSGFSFGLIIRHQFTNVIAVEGGINYVKRKFDLGFTDGDFQGNSEFRIIGYEIPLTAMFFTRVSENIYASGSLGPSCDMFASSILTYDEYFTHVASRKQVFNPAINGNVGFEYRTKNSGTVYLGASYHRPFSYIYVDKARYTYRGKDVGAVNFIVGSYLTVDLRYYFQEEKKKK
ncbi:MAG: hypothetical protein IPN61_10020 [Bacteroidetes bacterium]|nr:hypothetical protein [Bacteroidota bacterium]